MAGSIRNEFETDMEKMGKDPVTQRWWDVCKPCMNPLETRAEGAWWAEMEEIFHTFSCFRHSPSFDSLCYC